MKTHSVILLIFGILLIAGCNNNPNPSIVAAKPNLDSNAKSPKNQNGGIDSVQENDGCTGGIPDRSVVDSVTYPNRKFHLNGRIGYNEFKNEEGDDIIIEQSNCDYASYYFTIHTTRFKNDLSDTSQWVCTGADIIDRIKPALHVSVELDSGLYYLRKYYSEKGKALNQEIHFNDRPADQWVNVVIADSLLIKEKDCIIKLRFYEGPL